MKNFSILIMLLFVCGAMAQTYSPELEQRANNGNDKAQSLLGYCYLTGSGISKDYQMAFHWFTKSAEQGNTSAQYNLALCYENGWGVESDNKEHINWITKAANNGHHKAQYELGKYLLHGILIRPDTIRAISYLFDSLGDNFPMSNEQKEREMKVNSILEDVSYSSIYGSDALVCIGDIAHYRDNNYKNAEKYYKLAIDKGNCNAMISLGYLYLIQDATSENPIVRNANDNEAYWIEKSLKANNGIPIDIEYWYLSEIYWSGYGGITKDYKKSTLYLEKFIDDGNYYNLPDEDSLLLADRYYIGQINYRKSYEIYNKYYTNNDEVIKSWSACGLGRQFYYGRGVTQSYTKAFNYFNEAANCGDAEAMRFLSKCYRFGRGVSTNIDMAEKWHKKSIENNDSESKKLQELLEKDM